MTGARREVLFEFIQVGAQVRVAAVDAATGVEAVVLGPVTAARADLEQLALRKLQRLLDEADEGTPPAPRPVTRPGRLA